MWSIHKTRIAENTNHSISLFVSNGLHRNESNVNAHSNHRRLWRFKKNIPFKAIQEQINILELNEHQLKIFISTHYSLHSVRFDRYIMRSTFSFQRGMHTKLREKRVYRKKSTYVYYAITAEELSRFLHTPVSHSRLYFFMHAQDRWKVNDTGPKLYSHEGIPIEIMCSACTE